MDNKQVKKTNLGIKFLKILLIIIPLGIIGVSFYFLYREFTNSSNAFNGTSSWQMRKHYKAGTGEDKAPKRKPTVWWDKDTQVTFLSYNQKSLGRPWFNLQELKRLVEVFKKTATYGPEIKMLNAVIFDDYDMIDASALGQYISSTREIYINTQNFENLEFETEDKIKLVMPTLFHEYMHHWANIYVNTGYYSKLDNKNVDNIYYEGDGGSLKQVWNKNYVDRFLNLLNYDKNWIPQARANNFNSIASNLFNLKGIFAYANYKKFLTENYGITDSKFNSISEDKSVRFSPNDTIQYTLKQLKYYYSFTELVPREWTKVALDLGFKTEKVQGTNGQTFIDNVGYKKLKNNPNLEYKVGLYGLIIRTTSPWARPSSLWNKSNPSNTVSQDSPFIKLHKEDKKTVIYQIKGIKYQLITNTFIEDWARTRTVLLNSNDGSISFSNRLFFPNSIYGGEYVTNSGQIHIIDNKSEELLNLHLQSMGYGKRISQIFNKLDVYTWNKKDDGDYISYDSGSINNFKIMGYLPSRNYKEIHYTSISNRDVGVKLEYMPFTFRIKNKIVATDSNDFTYPADMNTNLGYITKEYININAIDRSKPLWFWNDKNNNNIIDSDEHYAIDISDVPNVRQITSYNSMLYTNYILNNDITPLINSYIIYIDNKKQIRIRKQNEEAE